MESARSSRVLLPSAAVLFGLALLALGGAPRSDLVVLFERPPGPREVSLIEGLGGQVVRESVSMPVLQITLPDAARSDLEATDDVLAVWHDRDVLGAR